MACPTSTTLLSASARCHAHCSSITTLMSLVEGRAYSPSIAALSGKDSRKDWRGGQLEAGGERLVDPCAAVGRGEAVEAVGRAVFVDAEEQVAAKRVEARPRRRCTSGPDTRDSRSAPRRYRRAPAAARRRRARTSLGEVALEVPVREVVVRRHVVLCDGVYRRRRVSDSSRPWSTCPGRVDDGVGAGCCPSWCPTPKRLFSQKVFSSKSATIRT